MKNEKEPESPARMGGGASAYETLAGTIFFLASGCSLLINAWPGEWAPLPSPVNSTTAILAVYLIAAAGFGFGWVRGFPRWSYPYGPYAFVFALYWMNVATPGVNILGHAFQRNELWGWRAWVPLLIVAAVAFIAARNLQPFICAARGISEDWTRLSFAVYGVMPLAVGVCFDEVRNDYEFPLTMAAIVSLVCGAFAFMRSKQMKPRVLSLLIGASVTILVVAAGNGIYWHGRQVAWMTTPADGIREALGVGAVGGVVLILMFLPALLELRPFRPEME